MNKRQIGFITISESMLEEFWYNNDVFVPLRTDCAIIAETHRYLCFCKHFRMLNEFDVIPDYDIEFERGRHGTIRFVGTKELK